MAAPADFLQSKAFATFEGVVNTFINALEQVLPAIVAIVAVVAIAIVAVICLFYLNL